MNANAPKPSARRHLTVAERSCTALAEGKRVEVELSQQHAAILLHFGLLGLQRSAEASEVPPGALEPFVLLSLDLMPNFRELETRAA